MYPNGPISHERHHFVFFLEIEQSLQAELATEEHEPSENLPGNQSDTSTEKPSADHNANDDDDDDDDNNDDDEFFLPISSKNLPTASEICANASYNNKNTTNNKSTRQNTVTNLIKAKFNQTISSTQRRQTDETVGLDDDDDDDDEGYDDREEILRQVYRHDSLAHRMSSSFTRGLSDCMQNLALETSQPRGLSSVTQHQNDDNDDDDSIEYVDDGENNDTHKVGECFEMDVFVDHQSPMGNNSMDSIITAPTSNANRKQQRRRKSATSTDAINDALLRVLEGSSGSSCKLSDDDLVPAEVQIGDIARRMDRRYSRRRSFTNAYAA